MLISISCAWRVLPSTRIKYIEKKITKGRVIKINHRLVNGFIILWVKESYK